MEEGAWSNLPPELLELILLQVPLSYHPYFSCVCKSWNKVTFPIYTINNTPLLVHTKKIKNKEHVLHYYHPSYNKTFTVNCSFDLPQSRFYFSKDGWLVIHQEHEVVLANPMTNQVHRYPGLKPGYSYTNIVFSGCPPNDCTILAIYCDSSEFVEIHVWDKSEGWHNFYMLNKNDFPFRVYPHSTPVFHNGCFYCLGDTGDIGIYDVEEDEWTVHRMKTNWNHKTYERSHLFEFEGELVVFLVVNGILGYKFVRLNQEKMDWENISTLGSKTLFAGSGVSVLTDDKFENDIYLSRFVGKPEIIQAEIKHCGNRIFFVPKIRYDDKVDKERTMMEKKDDIYWISTKTSRRSRYNGSFEYPCCIWYDPRV